MDNLIRIAVVEDEMIIGAKISMQLTTLGYEVTGILSRGEEVLQHVEESKPDIVLLDIHLKGKLDGIETGTLLKQRFDIPIIYLTANSDEATFNRAKATKPYAFISKPFKQLDLQRAIELTISRLAEPEGYTATEQNSDNEQPYILGDRIFVRHKDKMVKIMLVDILYIEADRNYSRIFTKAKEFLLSITLKSIEEKLTEQVFQRVHRSYIVNLSQIEEVSEDHLNVSGVGIPLSSAYKESLLQKLQKI